jgi:hypothetical protein
MLDMSAKKIRHFLCGLLCGAAGVYWYTSAAENTLEQALSWLESAADEYRSTHDVPQVDTGWGINKKKQENRL